MFGFWREPSHDPFPLRKSRGGGMNRSPERGKKKKFAPLPPAAPPPPRAYAVRPLHFPCFQFLPLPPPLPYRCRAARIDSRLKPRSWKLALRLMRAHLVIFLHRRALGKANSHVMSSVGDADSELSDQDEADCPPKRLKRREQQNV